MTRFPSLTGTALLICLVGGQAMAQDAGSCNESPEDYAATLIDFEGGTNHTHATNPISTATGSYQFLYGTLGNLGYIDKASSTRPPPGAGDWSGVVWTGKGGVYSREEFMSNQVAQDQALADFTQGNIDLVSDTFQEGQMVDGVPMTSAGAGLASHMLGAGGFRQWAASGFTPSGLDSGIAADHGWSQQEYQNHLMRRMAAGACVDPSSIETPSGGRGGGVDTVDAIPDIYLMPWSPNTRPAVLLPGYYRSLAI